MLWHHGLDDDTHTCCVSGLLPMNSTRGRRSLRYTAHSRARFPLRGNPYAMSEWFYTIGTFPIRHDTTRERCLPNGLESIVLAEASLNSQLPAYSPIGRNFCFLSLHDTSMNARV